MQAYGEGITLHEDARLGNKAVDYELEQGHQAAAGVIVCALLPNQQERMHQGLTIAT